MCTYTDNVVATGGNQANGAGNNVQTGYNGINSYGYGNNAVLTGGNEANGWGNNIGTGGNQINSGEIKEQSIPQVYTLTQLASVFRWRLPLCSGPRYIGVVNWFVFRMFNSLKCSFAQTM